MKISKLALLAIFGVQSFGTISAATYRELARSDLGVSYLIPLNSQRQDLLSIRTQLLQKKGQKSYYRDRITPIFRPIAHASAPLPTVLGKMTLLPLPSARDTTIPTTGVPVSCQEVKARYAEANEILNQIDLAIDALENALNAVDISTANLEQLELLTQKVVALSEQIQVLWAELQDRFPIRYSQEKYRLHYEWTYPFNQVCKDMNQRTIAPEITDLSMPGLVWSASSGQQLGDFLSILQTPQYELSRMSFVKEVSLVSACLDDQSLEIQGLAQAASSADCAFGGSNRFRLKAGTPKPMESPGAFTEKRLETVACTNLFADLRIWSEQASPLTSFPIAYQLSSLKLRPQGAGVLPKTYGGFMNGRLSWDGDHWLHRGNNTFSDRRDPTKPDQAFPVSQADDVSLQIDPNGTVSIVLHTWGNRSFTLQDLQCTNDPFASFISGWLIEDNGPALWTVSLHPVSMKKKIPIAHVSDLEFIDRAEKGRLP